MDGSRIILFKKISFQSTPKTRKFADRPEVIWESVP